MCIDGEQIRGVFDDDQIGALSSENLNSFSNDDFSAITTDAMAGVTVAQIEGLETSRSRVFSYQQIESLTENVQSRYNALYIC